MSRYLCPECGYISDEAWGDAHMGFAPGTAWADLPADFVCPDCAITYKEDFAVVDEAGS